MARQPKSSAGATSSSASIAGDADATAGLKPKRARKSAPRECPSQRTSVYRGVTRHRWTGRFEAHLWDKNTWSEPQRKKKGRQVYLGAYGGEEAAARAYDLAALKYWGRDTILNFPLANYDQELKEMEEQSREEYIGSLRRKSTGFSRGVSKYRGVARHHHNGKWEARIGRVFGNKYLYLGTYATQEEAAMAYDIAAIEHRGLNAVTNFDVSRYIKWHHLCRAGHADGLHDPGQLPIDHVAPHPSVDLDEAMAVAALHDDDQLLLPPEVSPPSHAALGLLLQSPGFKEMLELTAASESRTLSPSSSSCSPSPPPPPALTQQQLAEYSGNASSAWCSFTTSESSTISPSSSSCSPSPPPPPALTQQQLPEYSGSASSAPCSFPDDVQTYFGFEDHDGGVGYPEVDTFLFGDLGAYAAPMFQFELDL